MPKAAEVSIVLRDASPAWRALIVGGGKVARQKLKGLPKIWDVTLLSPKILASMKGRVRWIRRKARLSDVDKFDVIFAATNDAALNAGLAKRALKKRKLVCVADEPKLGNFSVPAVARAGNLSATISTSGASPALAKALRQWLEKKLRRPQLQALVMELGRKRSNFKKDPKAKRAALAKLGLARFLQRILR